MDSAAPTAGPHEAAVEAPNLAIQVRGLWKYFGHFPALRGLDLDVAHGRFLTIFGPNGAGKTTLIKVLSTQAGPSAGLVRVGGVDVAREAHVLRRRIGVISHNTYLYPNLTALENLMFYGRMYRVPDLAERARQLLAEVGLRGRMDDRAGTYSRGMQQRLSIARALLHEPDIMFLDEPYTGLDQHASKMLRSVLETLHTGERTIVLTTHNIEQGLEMCDEVAIQVRGRMVYREPSSAVDRGTFAETYFAHVGKEYRWDS
ncbi:MAG: ABC transporter ATP-binding protein [Thermoleophilia bacterium]